MTKLPVLPGVWWVEIPEEECCILCGSPADTIKHLASLGLIEKMEKDGLVYRSGPNAILLSDLPMQNGFLWNLVEFPILHMHYRQGLTIPEHPGYTHKKPMLIGLSEGIDEVADYLQRGSYGLLSQDEMRKSGLPNEDIENWWRLKLQFAGGKFRTLEDSMNVVRLNPRGGAITKKLTIKRLGINRYRFVTPTDTLDIDMNLPVHKEWYPSYDLPHHRIESKGFSVIHIGEGNGWDPGRACMGSLIVHGDQRYLVDAGPGIAYTLEHLGMDLNDVDAVFLTHVHDDHFSGFFDFARRDRPLSVYAAQPVMETFRYKWASFMHSGIDYFNQMIDAHSLVEGVWTDIDGLEAMPTFSSHPIETTNFFFRCQGRDGYKTYGHLADIISKKVMDAYTGKGGVEQAFTEKIYSNYARHCDVKKVDAGRGFIHGCAEDFANDTSLKMILTHTEYHIRKADWQYGVEATFGDVDILIPSTEDSENTHNFLDRDFPFFGEQELEHLKSCSAKFYPSNVNLSEVEDLSEYLCLLLSGSVWRGSESTLTSLRFVAGGLVGEEECLLNDRNRSSYITRTNTQCLLIPAKLYADLLESTGFLNKRLFHLEIRRFLCDWNFPGQKVACPRLDRLSEEVGDKPLKKGGRLTTGRNSSDAIYLLRHGSLINNETGCYLLPGEWLNLDRVMTPDDTGNPVEWTATIDSRLIIIPGSSIRNIPSLNWILWELKARM